VLFSLYELIGRIEVELVLDPGAVGLDGLDRQVEPFGNLAGRVAPTRQLKDLQLAIAQHLQGRLHDAVAPALGHALQQALVNLFAYEDAAVEHRADGVHDGVAGLLFHDVSAGPRPDAALGVEAFVVPRDD
jgi:hypothetical protein